MASLRNVITESNSSVNFLRGTDSNGFFLIKRYYKDDFSTKDYLTECKKEFEKDYPEFKDCIFETNQFNGILCKDA